jgi:hypothetical protein
MHPDIDKHVESVLAVTDHADNRFSRTFDSLRDLSQQLNTPLAIVGGLAGIYHGSGVTTLDIDIVVSASRVDEFATIAVANGFQLVRHSPRGWHLFESPWGVRVELLPSGQRTPRDPADAPPIPTPQELGVESGVGYAAFAPWVMMKLVAARDKDRYHLIEAIKQANEAKMSLVVLWLQSHGPQYLPEWSRLVTAAQDEDQSSW